MRKTPNVCPTKAGRQRQLIVCTRKQLNKKTFSPISFLRTNSIIHFCMSREENGSERNFHSWKLGLWGEQGRFWVDLAAALVDVHRKRGDGRSRKNICWFFQHFGIGMGRNLFCYFTTIAAFSRAPLLIPSFYSRLSHSRSSRPNASLIVSESKI